jgi:hypothetical protein
MNIEVGDLIIYERFDDVFDSSQHQMVVEVDFYTKAHEYYHNRKNDSSYRKLYIIPKEELEKYKVCD